MFMCGGFNYMEQYTKYMLEAIEEAKLAASIDEVPVGCVIVKDDKIVVGGCNQREQDNDPTGHAEIVALRRAAKILGDWQLVDCTLYVTIEPCIMCAGAIIQSRIKRVVYGAPDPRGGALGSSINVLEAVNINHRPEVVGGVRQEECAGFVKRYFKEKRKS